MDEPSERGDDAGGGVTTVCLYVCTYRRNEKLARLLETVLVAAEHAAGVARIGVVVVDDNPDGRAKDVVAAFEGRFSLGIHYRHTGAGNISVARNTGLATASQIAEWVAMTDDDCEVSAPWISALLATQRATDADAVCGPHVRRAPLDAPRWLAEHPFLGGAAGDDLAEGAEPPFGQTNNSLIRSAFLAAHPHVRFDEGLGTLGGEDVVFYHEARAAGLRLRWSRDAVVHEEAEGDRLTRRHYLRAALWFGNTQYVTSVRTGGLTRRRALLRGARRLAVAFAHPLRRLASRRSPELVYAASQGAEAVGLLLGPFGVTVRHPS